jgi:hypothetical protein
MLTPRIRWRFAYLLVALAGIVLVSSVVVWYFVPPGYCLQYTDTTRPLQYDSARIRMEHRWTAEIPVDNAASTPDIALSADQLFVLSFCGFLYAIDIDSQETQWTHHTATPPRSLRYDTGTEQVYATAGSYLSAYNTETGAEIWAQHFPVHPVWLYPFDNENGLFYIGNPGFYRVRNATGSARRIDDAPELEGEVRFFDETTAFVQTDDETRAIEIATQLLLWKLPIGCGLRYIGGDYLLLNCKNPVVVNKRSGMIVWRSPAELFSNVVAENGYIFALDGEARLHIVNTRSSSESFVLEFEKPASVLDFYNNHIAVYGSHLAVYFQDTNRLSLYEFEIRG